MSTVDQAWCPTCAEMTLPRDDGTCIWCDTPTTPPPRRRGGGKPAGKWGYLTDAQVRACHVLYMQGLSLNQVAERIWTRTRYASAASLSRALHEQFMRLGLPRRDRLEASIAASTIHGLARDPEHRRRLKIARGEVRGLQCAGVRTQYPRKGERCQRWAMAGSEYCISHDPARAGERDAQLAAMRDRRDAA